MRSLALLFVLGAAGTALADESRPTATALGNSYDAGSGNDPRAVTTTWTVAPKNTLVLGADFSFITADASPFAGRELKFTDVGLFTIRGLYVPVSRFEITADVELLPKQPSYTDELALQRLTVGARLAFAKRFAAGVRAAGGPVIDGNGVWGTAGGGIDWKTALDKIFVVQASVGGGYTRVEPDAATAWIVELGLGGSMMLQAPVSSSGYGAGTYVAIDLAFPIAHGDTGAIDIRPQTRLNFHTGMVLTFGHKWDMFIDFASIDRGDAEDPATQLPILHGGFDQAQVIFGMVRRFDLTRKKKPNEIAY